MDYGIVALVAVVLFVIIVGAVALVGSYASDVYGDEEEFDEDEF